MQIDHDAADYPYVQLARILRGRIADGTYTRRLPTTTDLEAESGLSAMAVRRAVALLKEEGLVESRPGRGVFVRSRAGGD